jgi:rRNA maturation RNase YbeY
MNEEWRDVSKSTDVLSFPANDFESPGVFSEDSSLQFEKHLGDLVVSPAYVMRQCKRDKRDFEVQFFYFFYCLFISYEAELLFLLFFLILLEWILIDHFFY